MWPRPFHLFLYSLSFVTSSLNSWSGSWQETVIDPQLTSNTPVDNWPACLWTVGENRVTWGNLHKENMWNPHRKAQDSNPGVRYISTRFYVCIGLVCLILVSDKLEPISIIPPIYWTNKQVTGHSPPPADCCFWALERGSYASDCNCNTCCGGIKASSKHQTTIVPNCV